MSCNSSSATAVKCEKSKRSRVGIVQRAGLLHMRAQRLAQRGVQQVRAGMVAHRGRANFRIDYGPQLVAERNRLLQPTI